jgi:hypothetical protein
MTAYLVLAGPGAQIPDERSVIIADRFAPIAFLAPLLWLLFNRLWLEALAAALVLAAAAMLSGTAGQPVLAIAIGLALSLTTALEGRSWRVAALQRRGWRLVDVINTDDTDTAFEIHVAKTRANRNASARPDPLANRQPLKLGHQPRGRETGSIGLVPVERN